MKIQFYYPLGTLSFHSFTAEDQAQYLCILRLHDFIRPLIDKHKHKVDLYLTRLTSRYFSTTNTAKEFLKETMSNGSLPDDVHELFVLVTFSGSRALGDLLNDCYNILFLLLASPLLVLDSTLPSSDYLATRTPCRITFKHFLEISRVTTGYSEFSLLMRKVFEFWKSPVASAPPDAAPAPPDGTDAVSRIRSSLYPSPIPDSTLDPISSIDDFAAIAPADPFPHIRPVDVRKEKELQQRKVDGLTISMNVARYKPLPNSFDSSLIISSVCYRTALSRVFTGLRVGGTCIVVIQLCSHSSWILCIRLLIIGSREVSTLLDASLDEVIYFSEAACSRHGYNGANLLSHHTSRVASRSSKSQKRVE